MGVGFEDEVDVGAELDAFPRRHREQAVVVEHLVRVGLRVRVRVNGGGSGRRAGARASWG